MKTFRGGLLDNPLVESFCFTWFMIAMFAIPIAGLAALWTFVHPGAAIGVLAFAIVWGFCHSALND